MLIDKVVGTLRRFYRDIQHDDPVPFGLGEMIMPESKRHRRFISSFVNYYHYCNMMNGELEATREKVKADARDMMAMEEDVRKLGEQASDDSVGFFGPKNSPI